MRFLIDNALPQSFAEGLTRAGHDAVHVRALGMAQATDREILSLALEQERIIVSADTDFGTILALYGLNKPSFILFRRSDKRPSALLMQLLASMEQIKGSLSKGAVFVIEDKRIRVRQLPVEKR